LLIASENGKSVLFVALGKEGILRRELPDGSWERLGVGDAEPTPYAASTLQGAIGDVWRELTISIASAFLAMFLAGLIAWKSLHRTDLHILDWTDWGSWTILVIGVCLLVSIGLAFALWALSDSPDRIFPAFASYFFYPLFILILWTSAGKWGRRIAVDNDLARKLTTRFLSIAVGVCLLASMPWLLWTFGIIPTYGLALFIAVLLALGFAGVGYRQIWRFGRGVRLEVQP
jgi:hypothetical protein